MDKFWIEILNNLSLVGSVFLVFVLLYIVNIILSIRINVFKLKEQWDNKKFWNGIVNMLSLGIGCSLMSIAFTMIPFIVNYFMITIPEDVLTFCTNAIIATVFFDAIFEYAKEVIEKLKNKTKIKKSGSEKTIVN